VFTRLSATAIGLVAVTQLESERTGSKKSSARFGVPRLHVLVKVRPRDLRKTTGLPPCILDKGKPVARPGRKAKDQPSSRLEFVPIAASTAGGLATERVFSERSRKRPLYHKHF